MILPRTLLIAAGVAVPLNSNNGETQLPALFDMRGETIDFIADGQAMPDTFSPLCGFAATLVLKQSGSTLGVGWYNADPARMTAPAASEIYEVVPAGSAVTRSTTCSRAESCGTGSNASPVGPSGSLAPAAPADELPPSAVGSAASAPALQPAVSKTKHAERSEPRIEGRRCCRKHRPKSLAGGPGVVSPGWLFRWVRATGRCLIVLVSVPALP